VRRGRGGLVDRVLRLLGFRRRPPERTPWPSGDDPGAGVREPRRPRPLAPAGAVELDLPDD
jgi:hypothetical protein